MLLLNCICISNIILLLNCIYPGLEPTKRDRDYICAYIQNGLFYNGACTTSERVICEIDGKRYSSVVLVLSTFLIIY